MFLGVSALIVVLFHSTDFRGLFGHYARNVSLRRVKESFGNLPSSPVYAPLRGAVTQQHQMT